MFIREDKIITFGCVDSFSVNYLRITQKDGSEQVYKGASNYALLDQADEEKGKCWYEIARAYRGSANYGEIQSRNAELLK